MGAQTAGQIVFPPSSQGGILNRSRLTHAGLSTFSLRIFITTYVYMPDTTDGSIDDDIYIFFFVVRPVTHLSVNVLCL